MKTLAYRTSPFCFFQPDYNEINSCDAISRQKRFLMVNNTAGYAGDHIYGGSLDSCLVLKCNSSKVFHALFEIAPKHLSAVTSEPQKICFCNNKEPDCKLRHKTAPEAKYPGDTVQFEIITVGQFNGTVPAPVLYHMKDPTFKLAGVITTQVECTTLTTRIMTNETEGLAAISIQLISNTV